MKKFKRILFATHGILDDQDTLKQAIFLTLNNNAQFNGLIACPPLPDEISAYKMVYENALLESLHQKIQHASEAYHVGPNSPFPIEIAYGENTSFTMIKKVLQHNYDLLIKEAEPLEEDKTGFKSTDMALLRKCPCPVWLHRPNIEEKHLQQVSVAIDANNLDEEHKALTLRLLELASSLAHNFDSRLHIISCWEYELEHYLDQHAWIKLEQKELNEKIEAAGVKNKSDLEALIKQASITCDTSIHHIHGSAGDNIPKYIKENEIDILVMGTLGRTGISGMLIGNTVEDVLQAVNCSLVALKPPGFVSPITL